METFTREFRERVRRKREQEKLADRRLREVPPPPIEADPVHAVYRGAVARDLRRVALARGESPQVLAVAIVAAALRNGAAEEIVGKDRAETIADGQGRRPFDGAGSLTLRQCAVIYLIGRKGGLTGWCGWSAGALSRLMPDKVTHTNVQENLVVLASRGLIERAPSRGHSTPRPARLTELGRAVFAEMSGDFGGAP